MIYLKRFKSYRVDKQTQPQTYTTENNTILLCYAALANVVIAYLLTLQFLISYRNK